MLYKLKALYVGGVILNYRKRYKELSDNPIIDCSESNLRKYIGQLKRLNYVFVDKDNKNLFLIGKNYLKEEFGVSKYSHKIEVNKSNLGKNNLEYVIKAISVNENLVRQKYVITRKLCNEKYDIKVGNEKEQKGSPDEKRDRKLLSYVKKDFDILLTRKQKRYLKSLELHDFKSINDSFFPFITLSRKGLSNCVKRKSKSTGSRLMLKLKEMGLVEKDDSNSIIMETDKSYDEYIKYKYIINDLFINYNYSFYINYNSKKRTIELKLPNLIEICE